ncbi:MAG: class I SAM-dependent methyltransferase [Candidatus Eremiobacteraeota bacterium]|nr:class I SAM-dependent methyltransferase [Candidatus Eremiobacteraeota bacterium]
MEKLTEIARRSARRDVGDFGMDASFEEAFIVPLVQMGVQDFRLNEMPELTGDSAVLAGSKRILDVGCGTAPLVYTALGGGHDAYGIDNDFEKIEIAHHKVRAYGLPADWTTRAILGDATRLDFTDEFFDIVTSYQVLEHIPDLSAALFESVRVTKRGGWIVFRAPDYRMSFEPHYRMPWPQFAPRQLAERWVMAMDRPPGGIGTFFYITLPQVAAILVSLGCELRVARLDWARQTGGYQPLEGPIGHERMLIKNDDDIKNWAHAIKEKTKAGTLDPVYTTELNMVLAARRV